MKNVLYLFIYCILMLSSISCGNSSDSKYFKGEITSFDDTGNIINAEATPISIDGLTTSIFAVYDSLAIFYSWKYSDTFFLVVNLNKNEELGYYCPKGGGDNEVYGISPISQFYEENGELKSLLFAPNNEKLIVWNISKSIINKTTVYDKLIQNNCKLTHQSTYLDIAYLSENQYVAYLPPALVNAETGNSLLPYYEIRSLSPDELVRKFDIFNKDIVNYNLRESSEGFFRTNNILKPDGSKIAMGMSHLPQMNILDLTTGVVKGFRKHGTLDFSYFSDISNIDEFKYYYRQLQADDKYVYATYYDGLYNDISTYKGYDIIHVFDWDGNFVSKIQLSQPVTAIWLDKSRNLLYGYNTYEQLCYFDLNSLGFQFKKDY